MGKTMEDAPHPRQRYAAQPGYRPALQRHPHPTFVGSCRHQRLPLAALSVIGLAHQNKVVTPPALAVAFPKAALFSAAVPAVVTAPVAKPSKAVATVSRHVAAGIVLGTSTTDGVVTQSQLQVSD
jgi:hypothetical protein